MVETKRHSQIRPAGSDQNCRIHDHKKHAEKDVALNRHYADAGIPCSAGHQRHSVRGDDRRPVSE